LVDSTGISLLGCINDKVARSKDLGRTTRAKQPEPNNLSLVWSPGLGHQVPAGHQDTDMDAVAPDRNKSKGAVMPKMKTKSSAKKRFRVRPGGTVKRGQAFKRHILTKKTTKNKRQLRGAVNVHETNMGHIAQMLPFAGL
jgi:large subunit ribosomal protein L35|tara:strand:- start:582 stop:1001 length:420 start_codon:yes stop_codon:yes gene_type:complete